MEKNMNRARRRQLNRVKDKGTPFVPCWYNNTETMIEQHGLRRAKKFMKTPVGLVEDCLWREGSKKAAEKKAGRKKFTKHDLRDHMYDYLVEYDQMSIGLYHDDFDCSDSYDYEYGYDYDDHDDFDCSDSYDDGSYDYLYSVSEYLDDIDYSYGLDMLNAWWLLEQCGLVACNVLWGHTNIITFICL